MLVPMTSGGKRRGAGRPKKRDARVTLAVRVLPVTRFRLEKNAEQADMSMGEIVDRLVDEAEGLA